MGKPTALVVEDDVDVAHIFGQALRAAGFEIEVANTGQQALTILGATTPDLIVLDIALPDISGVDILKTIKSAPHLSKTRVIVATAFPYQAEKLAGGADMVLLKPIPYAQLRDLSRKMTNMGSRVPRASLPEPRSPPTSPEEA